MYTAGMKTPFRPGRKSCHIPKHEAVLRFRIRERAKAEAGRREYWESVTRMAMVPFPDFEEEARKAN